MVENTLRMADPSVPIQMVHASRGNIIIYGMTMSCGICCRAAIRPAIAQFILSDLKEQFFLSDYKEFRDYNMGRAETKPGSPHIHKASPSIRGELPSTGCEFFGLLKFVPRPLINRFFLSLLLRSS